MGFRLQRFIIQTLVPLKRNAVDDGVFHHANGQGAAAHLHADIGKQASGEQGFQGVVHTARIDLIAFPHADIGQNGFTLDPLCAFNFYARDRRGSGLNRV